MHAATTLISIMENTGICLYRLRRAAAISFFRFVVESIIGARSIELHLLKKDKMVLRDRTKIKCSDSNHICLDRGIKAINSDSTI